jgi:hypothetical protein
MRKRLDANQTHAGAWIHDEAMQTGASLLHAAALRTTYARQSLYNLDLGRYAQPKETFGRISMLLMCGDHLQLPPVPKSSGLLASLENTSDEHKAGAAIFYGFEYLFEMHTMKRFTDPTLISILQKMRKLGGEKLTEEEWRKLAATQLDAAQLEADPAAFEAATKGWFESSYLWSRVTMASFTRATVSAREHKQILFYCQAVDFSPQLLQRKADMDMYDLMLAVPSLATTSRLPGCVMFHKHMRVRLTTQVLPPWAVQDATGTIMDINLSPQDRQLLDRVTLEAKGAALPSEVCLCEIPAGVYVKLDGCNREFLPPQICAEHQVVGFCKDCPRCRDFQGWVLVEPLCKPWSYTDPRSKATLQVSRTQLPLMPEAACPLYSLQGATCDPGLIAHFTMPKRADGDIKWLIVYVMLSRVRSLGQLRSVEMTEKIRTIIEGGPPEFLAENFDKLFRKKIDRTRRAAEAAKAALGWNAL